MVKKNHSKKIPTRESGHNNTYECVTYNNSRNNHNNNSRAMKSRIPTTINVNMYPSHFFICFLITLEFTRVLKEQWEANMFLFLFNE